MKSANASICLLEPIFWLHAHFDDMAFLNMKKETKDLKHAQSNNKVWILSEISNDLFANSCWMMQIGLCNTTNHWFFSASFSNYWIPTLIDDNKRAWVPVQIHEAIDREISSLPVHETD